MEQTSQLLQTTRHQQKLSEIYESKPGSQADDDDEAAEQYEGTVAVMVIGIESRN